jgi:hypothetical protein
MKRTPKLKTRIENIQRMLNVAKAELEQNAPMNAVVFLDGVSKNAIELSTQITLHHHRAVAEQHRRVTEQTLRNTWRNGCG